MSTGKPMDRFTAYLSEREREGLRKLADELGTSENFIVRTAIRSVLGMDTPGATNRRLTEQTQQTDRRQPA